MERAPSYVRSASRLTTPMRATNRQARPGAESSPVERRGEDASRDASIDMLPPSVREIEVGPGSIAVRGLGRSHEVLATNLSGYAVPDRLGPIVASTVGHGSRPVNEVKPC